MRATDVVWRSPVLVCALTVMLTVLLFVLGWVELAWPPHPIALPPNARMPIRIIDRESSLQNSLRRFDEIQNSKGRKAKARGTCQPLVEFDAAVRGAVWIVIFTIEVPSACFAAVPKLQVEPAGSPAHTMDGFWLNPFTGVMSNETSTLFPGTVETDDGVASTVKSGPRIFTATANEVEAAKELLPT